MKLFTIADELRQLTDAIMEAEGEITPEQDAALVKWQASLEVKATNCLHVIKSLDAEIGLAAEYEKRARQRRCAAEQLKEHLRTYVADAMQFSGTRQIQAEQFRITLCPGRNEPVVEIPPEQLPEDCRETIVTHKPLRAEIKARLLSGEVIVGCHLETGKPYIRIT